MLKVKEYVEKRTPIFSVALTHGETTSLVFALDSLPVSKGKAVRKMTWDSPLHAVNMFYYRLLIKKLLWLVAGQNRARQEN